MSSRKRLLLLEHGANNLKTREQISEKNRIKNFCTEMFSDMVSLLGKRSAMEDAMHNLGAVEFKNKCLLNLARQGAVWHTSEADVADSSGWATVELLPASFETFIHLWGDRAVMPIAGPGIKNLIVEHLRDINKDICTTPLRIIKLLSTIDLLADRELIVYGAGVLFNTGKKLQSLYDAVRFTLFDTTGTDEDSQAWDMYRKTISAAMEDCGCEPRKKSFESLQLLNSLGELCIVSKQYAFCLDAVDCDQNVSVDADDTNQQGRVGANVEAADQEREQYFTEEMVFGPASDSSDSEDPLTDCNEDASDSNEDDSNEDATDSDHDYSDSREQSCGECNEDDLFARARQSPPDTNSDSDEE
jgi:hypothetical protein